MADTKISELTAVIEVADDDVLPIVDTSAVGTRKVTVADLLAGLMSAPSDPVQGYVLVYGPTGPTWERKAFVRNAHGSNAAAARLDADINYWVGSVEPANWTDEDLWLDTSVV